CGREVGYNYYDYW
nr:immunoglobulin heavy chain junction region [Macaca mulatta]